MSWFNIYWENYNWQLTCIANSNPCSNSSVKPPSNILKDIQNKKKTFYEFLWNINRDNVKKEISTKGYEDGGLKMIDIKLFYQALTITCIKKYINLWTLSA
jgi:hypothetical protein